MNEQPKAFDCSICKRHIDTRWPGPKQTWPIDPVCRYCEEKWGARAPAQGAFRDRRLARQISALANAIDAEAHQQQWSRFHGA